MPRIAWSRLLVLLLALPLASCFDGKATCPTCPTEHSGRIDVVLPLNGDADSLHVFMDGGPKVTVRRGKRAVFQRLSSGAHSVFVVRWYEAFDVVTSRSATVEIKLEAGESRVVSFHNDFPLIADVSPPGGVARSPVAGPAPRRVG